MPGILAMEVHRASEIADQTSHRQTGSETDASWADSPSDTGSIEQNSSPPNAIEALLDAALIAHPQLDAVVIGWAVLEEFWAVS